MKVRLFDAEIFLEDLDDRMVLTASGRNYTNREWYVEVLTAPVGVRSPSGNGEVNVALICRGSVRGRLDADRNLVVEFVDGGMRTTATRCTDPGELVAREEFQGCEWSGWGDPRNACTAQDAIDQVPRPGPWCICPAQRLTHRRTSACKAEES